LHFAIGREVVVGNECILLYALGYANAAVLWDVKQARKTLRSLLYILTCRARYIINWKCENASWPTAGDWDAALADPKRETLILQMWL
jgi:hypothetical protein